MEGPEGQDRLKEQVVAALRSSGASFALVFGSTARGTSGPGSDLDVGAFWRDEPPQPWDVELPEGVDLVVLDRAPLELAGTIALEGQVLFEDDPNERVRWVAQYRRIWLDERPRFLQAHREFLEAVRGR
ncbi:MAG: nucleotidyltransferase domain-containing protein [Candidatus Nanopelagicales bacterium]